MDSKYYIKECKEKIEQLQENGVELYIDYSILRKQHKNKRINKKWNKKYGCKYINIKKPNPQYTNIINSTMDKMIPDVVTNMISNFAEVKDINLGNKAIFHENNNYLSFTPSKIACFKTKNST